jgi:tetratricopeptide (TPR) repeat protein
VQTSNQRKRDLLALVAIVTLIVAAYSNTLQAPFVFDDQGNIADNLSIRNLWPPWSPFFPSETGIVGRPFINFTFALNYAISGDNVWSYHALNIIIHILAAMTLWGIIRRTLINMKATDRYGPSVPAWIALGCTLIWALHPLQTQAVTYLSQRCESLMGLFFLLVFYCAIRGWHSAEHKRAWHLFAILSFVGGAGCKEVIAAAPVLLLLYDWIFNKKTLPETFKTSPLLYAGMIFGLAGEFLLIAGGGTISAGTGDHRFTLIEYWLTQPSVILHYIRLVFWPSSLTLDYGMDFHGMIETWPALFIIVALIVISLWLLYRRHPAGFLSAWFFTILAPTSLYPLPDVAYEHRMYLPSVAVIMLTLSSLYRWGRLLSERFITAADERPEWLGKASWYVMVLLVLAAAISTYTRNLYYQTEVSLWADNVAKRPQSGRAQANLGNALYATGRPLDALHHIQRGIRLMESQRQKPHSQNLIDAYNNLGVVYFRLGELQSAEFYLRKSLQIGPKNAHAHAHLGRVLSILKQDDEAQLHFQKALSLDPNYVDGLVTYGVFLLRQGNINEAAALFQKALNLRPGHIGATNSMGTVLYRRGQYSEARAYFQKALAVKPDNEFARNMLSELEKKDRTPKTGVP